MSVGTIVQNFKGLEVFPRGTSLNVRSLPSLSSAILYTVKQGEKAGITTGNVNKMSDGDWWQISGNGKTGYVRNDVAVANKVLTVEDAKDIISKLVESDKAVYDKLLQIAPLIEALKKKGVNVKKYETTYSDLISRLKTRQDDIKKSNLVKWKAGIKKGFENFSAFLIKYGAVNHPGMIFGIGAEPFTIIVAVVFGIGITVAAYYIFKPKYSESQQDLKISADLEKALGTLSPETREKVKKDLEKQIDKAYNQGQTDGTFGSFFSIGKYVLFAFAGYFLVTKFVQSQSKTK